MTTRRNVERQRDIIIRTDQWNRKITANALVEATRQLFHDEYILEIVNFPADI